VSTTTSRACHAKKTAARLSTAARRNATAFGPVYSPNIYTSRWGSYLSGYAPVKDSNGTVVGVLGVDETKDTVLSYETYRFFNLVEMV
jgi:hypothetical protein